MSDLVAAAAAKLGSPEHLVERSAAARAEADGLSVEEVLTAWAGGVATPSEQGPRGGRGLRTGVRRPPHRHRPRQQLIRYLNPPRSPPSPRRPRLRPYRLPLRPPNG